LLAFSREPLATVTVRSVCGVRAGRSWAVAAAAVPTSTSVPATRVASLIT
jgi:hypothetical protein